MRPTRVFTFLVLSGFALAAGAQESNSSISFDATLHKLDPKGFRGQPVKLFTLRLLKGNTYVLDMISKEFDCYLRLERSNLTAIAEDDDSGGNLNSRIRFTANEDDDYRVLCTTYNGAVGNFVLRITQESPAKKAASK